MTIIECLNEFLIKENNIPGTTIAVYSKSIEGKGRVTVEYDNDGDKATIIHESQSRRNDFYEAESGKDLKDILEFCLGPLVSERQWNSHSQQDDVFDYDDDIDYHDEA